MNFFNKAIRPCSKSTRVGKQCSTPGTCRPYLFHPVLPWRKLLCSTPIGAPLIEIPGLSSSSDLHPDQGTANLVCYLRLAKKCILEHPESAKLVNITGFGLSLAKSPKRRLFALGTAILQAMQSMLQHSNCLRIKDLHA